MTAVAIVFWVCVGLLVYAHVGYAAAAGAAGRGCRVRAQHARDAAAAPPTVSVIVAAYAEEEVIGARIANLRGLDYPA